MDGGSVYLEATDATGRLLRISLNWSIDAQRKGATRLTIDGVEVRPGSADETEWIECLQRAQIAAADDPATVSPPPAKRVVLAADAKTYFAAIDQGPRSALSALRDDLLRKIKSPAHGRNVGANFGLAGEAGRPGPLPLP